MTTLTALETITTTVVDPNGQTLAEGLQLEPLWSTPYTFGSDGKNYPATPTVIGTATQTLSVAQVTTGTSSSSTSNSSSSFSSSSESSSALDFHNATTSSHSPTTTTHPATTTSATVSHQSSSDTGKIAGAAVGGIIGGLLLGFLAAFLLLRRRRRNKSPVHAYNNVSASEPTIVTAAAVEPKGLTKSPPPHDDESLLLSRHLLDALPDRDLASDLQSISHLLQQHVENYYHSDPVRANAVELASSLKNLGVGLSGSLTYDAVVALALDPRTRPIAVQHVLSTVLFGSVDVEKKSRLSMLPTPVAAFLASVPPAERGGVGEEATNLALHRWRTLSAFLLHPQRSQRTPLVPPESALSQQASGLVSALNSFLRPFIAPGQQQHLEAVMFEVARFGYKVFSQPAQWRFVYSTAGGSGGMGGRQVVVCPGLSRAGDVGEERVVVQPVEVQA